MDPIRSSGNSKTRRDGKSVMGPWRQRNPWGARGFQLSILLAGIWLLFCLVPIALAEAQADAIPWEFFENLSRSGGATEPKIAADQAGQVHVAWSQRSDPGETQVIYYSHWSDGQWTEPVDVLLTPGGALAWVADIEVDRSGTVHVVWMAGDGLYYSNAEFEGATKPQGWATPTRLAENVAFSGWAAALLNDRQERLHLVYGDSRALLLHHMYSDDGGARWSSPGTVGETGGVNEATTSTMLVQDGAGRLHATWTVREMPRGWPGTRAFYARSLDGGLTWSEPLLVDDLYSELYDPDRGPFFLSVGTRGRDEVHLAWAGAPKGGRWHQWSSDGGETWRPMEPVFGDRFGTTGFLDMVEDGAGQLHLFTTFGDEPSPGIPLESLWLGSDWSEVAPLPAEGIVDCEDPRAVTVLGDQLHLVCIEQSGAIPADVFHIWRALDAPGAAPQALATPALPSTPGPERTPSAGPAATAPPTRTATRAAPAATIVLEAERSASSPYLPSALGAGAALLIVSIVVAVVQLIRRRRTR
jgi:hypothetical protein